MDVMGGVARIARRLGLLLAVPSLVLGVVVAGGVPSAMGAGTWLPPADVSAGGQEVGGPQVDVSADGRRAIAVWYRYDGARYMVQTSRSLDGGATWLAPQDLSPGDQDWRFPRIAMSDDGMRAVAVWTAWDANVWTRSTADGGASWTAAQQIGGGGNPRVVMSYDGLRITAAWDDILPDGQGNYYQAIVSRSSTDGGITWQSQVRVSPFLETSDYVDLVASPDGLQVTAAWLANGHLGVEVGTSGDGGATWDVSAVTSESAVVWDKHLSTSTDGQHVAVVWGKVGTAEVMARVSHDGATTWAPIATLDIGSYPQVAMSGDGLRITALWYGKGAWNDVSGDYDYVASARSSSDGINWTAVARLSADVNSPQTRPRLAGGGSRVTALWGRTVDANGEALQSAQTSDGGSTWGPAIDLTGIDRPNIEGVPAASADGTCVVTVWSEWASAQTNPGRIRSRSRIEPPTIMQVTPTSGPTTGGTSVGILGSGFGGATSVTFGSVPATSFTVWSPGHITATTPPGSPGAVGVTVTTAAGSMTLPAAFTYVAVDTTPPVTRMVTPSSPVSFSSTFRLTFTGRDVGGAVASYQVQRAVKAPGGALGGYVNYGGPRTTASVTMTGAKSGYGYCFRVRGTDTAGNTSAWSSPVCETLPGDDRVLAGRVGWSRPVVKTAYLRTLTVSRTKGATLVLAKSRGSYLTLVVNKVPGGGTLGVYVKGKKVATVPTTARRAALKVLVTLKVRTAGVPVVLRLDAPGARGVAIDGIAQLP